MCTVKKYEVKIWQPSKAKTPSLKCWLESFFMPMAIVTNFMTKVFPANLIWFYTNTGRQSLFMAASGMDIKAAFVGRQAANTLLFPKTRTEC